MIADFANNIIVQVILVLLSISTLIGILDHVGFLPPGIREKLKLNRSDDIFDILIKLGIDIDQYRRSNQSVRFPKAEYDGEMREIVNSELKKNCIIQKKVVVGHLKRTEIEYYYDLIGKTCDPVYSKYFAEILSTFWSKNCLNLNIIHNAAFDFVVTPKAGSPILGYEFAKLIRKPFMLHEQRERFSCNTKDMRTVFDCFEVPPQGSTALIVDDSVTGGTLIINAITDLRKYGFQVHTCLVVFEVKVKDAKKQLQKQNVQLVSIVETHKKNM